MHIVVIGISAAGISALTKIRQLNKEVQLTAITYESEVPYNKCFLVDYIDKEKTLEQISLRSADFFSNNAIRLMSGKRVVAIHPQDQQLIFDDNSSLIYDKLLCATGLEPVVPPIVGIHDADIFYFNTRADAQALYAALDYKKPTTATVIGAGLTGVEVADALVARGLTVNVVDAAERMLVKHIDASGALFLASRAVGVTFYGKRRVQAVRTMHDDTYVIQLDDGTSLVSDIVVCATGARLNTELFVQAGIDVTAQGIPVNEYMQTNNPSIYAAGDNCRIQDQIYGHYVQSSTWPDACMQGMIAGMNMVGEPKAYPGAFVLNNSHFFGGDFYSYGNFQELPATCEQFSFITDTARYHFYVQQGRVVAFYVYGVIEHLGAIKRMMLGGGMFDPSFIEGCVFTRV